MRKMLVNNYRRLSVYDRPCHDSRWFRWLGKISLENRDRDGAQCWSHKGQGSFLQVNQQLWRPMVKIELVGYFINSLIYPMWMKHGEWRETYVSHQHLRGTHLTSHTRLDDLLLSFEPQKGSMRLVLSLHFTGGDWGLACGCRARKRERLDLNTAFASRASMLTTTWRCLLTACPPPPLLQSFAVSWFSLAPARMTGRFSHRLLALWSWSGSLLLK